MKILLISDLHGYYNFSKEHQNLLNQDYDAYFLLGDTEWFTLKELLKYIPRNKLYGVLGNRDSWDLYEKYGITNIHNKKIEIDGITFVGFQRSKKYSNANKPMYTQEESQALCKQLPKADVLISHTSPHISIEDESHSGLIGISEYILNNQPKYHFHGHHHEETSYKMGNTEVCGVWRFLSKDI